MYSNLSTDDLRALDAAHHLHPFTDHGALGLAERRVIARADGVWLWDTEGNRMLDGMAGLWCVNIGHGRQEIAEAVRAADARTVLLQHLFQDRPCAGHRTVEALAELAPPQFNHVLLRKFGLGGQRHRSVRMVRTYWDRDRQAGQADRHSIACNAYHGSTMGGGSLGGMAADPRPGRPADSPRGSSTSTSPTGSAKAAMSPQ